MTVPQSRHRFTPVLILAAIAAVVAAVMVTGCGRAGSAHPAGSAFAAHPTASADVAAAKGKAERIAGQCAERMGGTRGPGLAPLLSPRVLSQLLTRRGRATFLACAVPSPAKRHQATVCFQNAFTPAAVFTRHGRARAAQALFTCLEGDL